MDEQENNGSQISQFIITRLVILFSENSKIGQGKMIKNRSNVNFILQKEKNACQTCVFRDTFTQSWIDSKDILGCLMSNLKDTLTQQLTLTIMSSLIFSDGSNSPGQNGNVSLISVII